MKTEHKVIVVVLLIIIGFLFFNNQSEHVDNVAPQTLSNEAIQNIVSVYANTTGTSTFNNLNVTNNLKSSSLDVSGNTNIRGALSINGIIEIDSSGNISTLGNISANKIIPKVSNNIAKYIQVGYDPSFGITNNNRWTINQVNAYDISGSDVAKNKPVTKIIGSGSYRDIPPSFINSYTLNASQGYFPDVFYESKDNTAQILEIDLGKNYTLSSIDIFGREDYAERCTGTFIKLLIDDPKDNTKKVTVKTIYTGYWTRNVKNKFLVL